MPTRPPLTFLLPALLLAVVVTPTVAFGVGLLSGVSGNGPVPNCLYSANTQTSSPIAASIGESDCGLFSGFSGSFTSSAAAQSTYGTLLATAEVTYAGIDRPTSSYARGTARGVAQFEDTIVLDAPGRTGEVVDLIFAFELNGNASAQISGSGGFLTGVASGLLRTRVNGSATFSKSISVGADGSVVMNDFGPGMVQITLGTPFDVWVELRAEAALDDVGSQPLVGVDGNALAAYGNSGGITSFSLTDSNGLAVEGFSISSTSGQFAFYVAPEPSVGVLLGFGSALAWAGARRTRAHVLNGSVRGQA